MNNPEESAGAGVVSNPGRPDNGLVIRRISLRSDYAGSGSG